jgi:hypothetical protein
MVIPKKGKGKGTKKAAGSSATPPSKKPAVGQPARTVKKGTPPPPAKNADLDRALEEAREQIRSLIDDRDEQVALGEAAEMEREALEGELTEARARIHVLEKELAERSPSEVVPAREGDEGALGFEEEEEEEEPPETEDLDDVEGIYDRMDDPRVRRQELDRERIDRESEAGDESYWRVCPKCGDSLDEVESEDVKIDRCETCGGIYLDHGEIEMLLSIARGPHGLRRVRSALQI